MIILSIRQLVYLFLVTSTIFSIALFCPASQNHWLIWAALFLALISVGQYFVYRLEVICATVLACGFAVWFAEIVNVSLIAIGVYLFLLTAILTYYSQRYPLYAYPIFIINVFGILASFSSLWVGGDGDKTLSIAKGAAIVLVCQLVFLYRYVYYQWLFYVLGSLTALKKLNQELFSCLLREEYADNIYIFERRIHTQKQKLMQSMVALSELKLTPLQMEIVKKLNMLLDAMLDYAQLRRRINDFNILHVCSAEMAAIEKDINLLLLQAKKGITQQVYFFNTESLSASIQRFEDNYHQVLQVASKEPLVFLLFISGLRSFCEEMSHFD